MPKSVYDAIEDLMPEFRGLFYRGQKILLSTEYLIMTGRRDRKLLLEVWEYLNQRLLLVPSDPIYQDLKKRVTEVIEEDVDEKKADGHTRNDGS